jgi:threonine/homoserine/homoserine lactone efflux protein
MLAWSSLPVFIAATLGLLILPGPAVLYIVTRSVSQGRRAGLASVLGIELGSLCHAVAAAFGLSAILLASALAFNIVKYVGAAYLVYLGIRTLLRRSNGEETEGSAPRSASELFRKGLVVQLLNPKTALFFYAFLPQFVDPGRGSPVLQILALGGLFTLLATCTDSTYALLGSSVGGFIKKRPGFRRAQNYVSGGIYIALGAAAALTGEAKK